VQFSLLLPNKKQDTHLKHCRLVEDVDARKWTCVGCTSLVNPTAQLTSPPAALVKYTHSLLHEVFGCTVIRVLVSVWLCWSIIARAIERSKAAGAEEGESNVVWGKHFKPRSLLDHVAECRCPSRSQASLASHCARTEHFQTSVVSMKDLRASLERPPE